MERTAITILLPTYNCETTVRATLESIKWADEILVVDSYSTDSTLDICREYGARVVQHEYITSAKQKNWALEFCTERWVLQVDSDETLGPGLGDEIAQAIANAPSGVDAFRVPRKNFFLGRWLQYGGNYPDYQYRLFRRDLGKWQDREVHAHVVVPGHIGTLTNPLLHDDWPTLSKALGRLDRYTRYEADELKKNNIKFQWHDLVLRPIAVFFYRYIWLHAFRDGWRGFIFASYMSIYVFLTRAKLWELELFHFVRSPR